MSPYQNYTRKGTTSMRPWDPEINMEGVSITDADRAAGSPKDGDMIARNRVNPEDRWLVAKAFFEAHYHTTPQSSTPVLPPQFNFRT